MQIIQIIETADGGVYGIGSDGRLYFASGERGRWIIVDT